MADFLGSGADMKRSGAVREIDGEAAKGKNITPYQNVVWRLKGGESYDFDLDVAGWQRDSDTEERKHGWGKPRLVSFGMPNLFKFQLNGQRHANRRCGSSGVDLREHFDARPPHQWR
jgi:hypothetical protein